VADGIHITAVGQVGPFRAATVRRIKGRVAQVGDTVKRISYRLGTRRPPSGGLLF
jgi:hypothetical protein